MAFVEPTLTELVDQFKANIQTRINQTIPPVSKAFATVISYAQAIAIKGLYKYATDRTRQTLGLTATAEDLDTIGDNYGTARKAAEATVLEIDCTGTPTTVIPQGTEWISDSNNETYTQDADGTISSGGTVTVSVTAATVGEDSNLANGETLSIGVQIAGVDSTATVSDTTNDGLDRETDTEYRRRVLSVIRTQGGGGNTADYRNWAEEVSDVAKAFPYSGKPITFLIESDLISFAAADDSFNSGTVNFINEGLQVGDVVTISGATNLINNGDFNVLTVAAGKVTTDATFTDEAIGADVVIRNQSLPGDRTVYVESRTAADGIPPASLLDDVRDSINTDPDTGIARPPLGETDETLYVEPISRTTFDVEIRNLNVDAAIEAATKANITTALENYFETTIPFVTGLDFEGDRTDTITDLSVSTTVQGVLQSAGASADGIAISIGADTYPAYTLQQGELAKLGSVSYV